MPPRRLREGGCRALLVREAAERERAHDDGERGGHPQRGARLMMVSDSCHSGGLIDNEKEQIGPSADDVAAAGTPANRARFIPYAALVDYLAGASGDETSHHAADHLVALFGADASAKFQFHHHEHHHRHDGAPPAQPRPDDDAGILLSGCQTDEMSADVFLGGKACGAFSNALQAMLLVAHPAPVSNREVVTMAMAFLYQQQE